MQPRVVRSQLRPAALRKRARLESGGHGQTLGVKVLLWRARAPLAVAAAVRRLGSSAWRGRRKRGGVARASTQATGDARAIGKRPEISARRGMVEGAVVGPQGTKVPSGECGAHAGRREGVYRHARRAVRPWRETHHNIVRAQECPRFTGGQNYVVLLSRWFVTSASTSLM